MARPKRARTEKREAARRGAKVASDREKLFFREEGGNPARPIEVGSAGIVESRARATPCPLCGGEQEVREHLAVTVAEQRLRETKLQCRRCATKRSMWFRIALVN